MGVCGVWAQGLGRTEANTKKQTQIRRKGDDDKNETLSQENSGSIGYFSSADRGLWKEDLEVGPWLLFRGSAVLNICIEPFSR